MTDIDVPDWVTEAACRKFYYDWDDVLPGTKERLRESMQAALRAALSAWVVPALWRTRMVSIGDGFVYPWMDDEDPEIWAHRAKRYAPAESLRVEQCTLYALRQEKPE
jgi:hypothetical protein